MHIKLFKLQRLLGYFLGFLLFYEPFMFFNSLFAQLFPANGFYSLHVPCARIPIAHLITGGFTADAPASLLFCLLLAIVSFWFGPLFCGRLCPAGAFSEFLGSLLPEKYQIDWNKYVPVTTLRYGFLAGFLLTTFLGLAYPCVYCNYYALELFVLSIASVQLLLTSMSLLAVFLISNIVLGLFTKGGRGYCNFLCPVGAVSSLLHNIGQLLPGPFRMTVNKNACISCGKCARSCPMRTISIQNGKAVIDINRCIVCGCCQAQCPAQAIRYKSNIAKEL